MNVAAREKELNEQYPNRPRNEHTTLPFHTLFQDLFNPLLSNQKKKPGAPTLNRRKIGPDGGLAQGTNEMRRAIIERYISRWRSQVGYDFFPAMRLILPEKDRDRAMYGLKEKALGKYLVKIMKIDKNSEDGFSILNWKLPSKQMISQGDFASRCYEVLQKRPFRVDVGDMTIEEVNEELDKLSAAQKEETQLPIIGNFYRRMNAEEMTWLIRVILRQMKVGATEKTFLGVFHPDADALFNVSSSLRRVCWELWDENIRLESEHKGVTLMQCFQPQLATYDGNDFPKLVEYLRRYATEEDKEFWIEEKLDGERMQMHIQKSEDGFNFKFFSRKAKDYTYLYGSSLNDKNSALTQHLEKAFHEGIDNMILDGEMITWDPILDRQAAFGTLKTAAISEQNNPFTQRERPLYRIFDILLLNDKLLAQYTLRDRRKALEQAVKPVHRRFELHSHHTGIEADDINPHLHAAIETASEGLVLKNPRSLYTLNDRNRDWLKVKPEYMQSYGESLDCLVIAGYYGSGKRGGFLSSFLCGLRADKHSNRFLSFFKVGGGMSANDYATIQHHTDGKWMDYNVNKPPKEYIELAGPAHAPKERPDQWIKPQDSIVLEVKAASIGTSDEFATKLTLRFPRFRKIRTDRDWTNSLTVQEFLDLKAEVETKEKEQEKFKAEQTRAKRKATNTSRKKPLKVVGYGLPSSTTIDLDTETPVSHVFHNLTFYVITNALHPAKYSKPDLEALIKRHGGKITQSAATTTNISSSPNKNNNQQQVLCIADRPTVKASSLVKSNTHLLIRPQWLFDCIAQARTDFAHGQPERVVLFEPKRHLFFTPDEQQGVYDDNVDEYGDAFYRDTSVEELRAVFAAMKKVDTMGSQGVQGVAEHVLNNSDDGAREEVKGAMFRGIKIHFVSPSSSTSSPGTDGVAAQLEFQLARNIARFAGAVLAEEVDEEEGVTHVVVGADEDITAVRKGVGERSGGGKEKVPWVVRPGWVNESWKEGTVLEEEGFVAR